MDLTWACVKCYEIGSKLESLTDGGRIIGEIVVFRRTIVLGGGHILVV